MAVVTGAATIWKAPPVPKKPDGLKVLEEKVNQEFQDLLTRINARSNQYTIESHPPIDPDAPAPRESYRYNNLLENQLSALHFYYRIPLDTPVAEFVTSWDAETGEHVILEQWLLSVENNVNYLLTLEMYRRLHAKALFDEDLEFARQRVDDLFAGDWSPVADWPIGAYFDLVRLYEVTEDDIYLEYADRFVTGEGPENRNTPLLKAKSLAFSYSQDLPRQASPFYFYHAALLADYGNRHDPALLNAARNLFGGVKDLLYDSRFKMFWKQGSVAADGTINLIQTIDTLEQVSAIRAITEYGRASGNPEALSLVRSVLDGIWGGGSNSPLWVPASPGLSENTYYGLYTAYDHDREAKRLDPAKKTINQILFYLANVFANREARGEFRGDVDFLANWLESNGPMFRRDANGYYQQYGDDWADPEHPSVSAQASIWMARALVEDEWYKYQVAQALTSRGNIE